MAQTTTTIKSDTSNNIIKQHITIVTTQTDYFMENDEMVDTYLKKHMRHIPNTHGTVMVSFKIEKDGSVTNVKIDKGLNKAADAEALRLMKGCPKWIPDTMDGKPISYTAIQPVIFK